MIVVRRDKERHHIQRQEQESWLTFNLQNRMDLLADGFAALEALQEDRIQPGADISHQPDRDGEIITYVRQGTLTQSDLTGWSDVIHASEFQHRTTRCNVPRRERNARHAGWAHVFRMSLTASETSDVCEQKFFSMAQRRNVLCIVVSPDGRKGSLSIRQDTLIGSAILDVGQHLVHELSLVRSAWLHLVKGEVNLGDIVLFSGDSAGYTAERAVSLTALEEAEILLFDFGTTLQRSPGEGGVP